MRVWAAAMTNLIVGMYGMLAQYSMEGRASDVDIAYMDSLALD